MKQTAFAKLFVAAPVEVVFDTFTGLETYPQLLGVRNTELLEKGNPEIANGKGAVRKINLKQVSMTEKVTGFNRPYFWDYIITQWPAPYAHAGGRMSFQAVPGGTLVTWATSIQSDNNGLKRLALPVVSLLGSVGLKFLALQMGRIAVKNAKK